jgi:hypothetical protein
MSTSVLCRLAAGIGLVLLAAEPASAQIGGLVKKARDAATKKPAEAQPVSGGLPSSAFGSELDDASLSSLMKGLRAMAAKGDQRDALQGRLQKLQTQLSASLDQHQADKEKFDAASDRVRDCQTPFLEKRLAEHRAKIATQAMATGAPMDHAAQKRMMEESMKHAQEMQAAMQKGDTAAARRIGQAQADKQLGKFGVDLHADTVAAEKVCGAKPARPAWLVEQEALRAQIESLSDQVRDAEREMTLAGVSASGMQADRFGLARERVLNWYRGEAKGGRPIQRFGDRERKLFESRRAELEQVVKAL